VGDVTLLIGGARSGKSALAVDIGMRHDGDVVFVATAEPFDDDMRSRIARHRNDRPDWPVVEARSTWTGRSLRHHRQRC